MVWTFSCPDQSHEPGGGQEFSRHVNSPIGRRPIIMRFTKCMHDRSLFARWVSTPFRQCFVIAHASYQIMAVFFFFAFEIGHLEVTHRYWELPLTPSNSDERNSAVSKKKTNKSKNS